MPAMLYLNAAGLSPFHPDVQQEITRTLEAFSDLLYSEGGLRFYRDTLQQCRRTISHWLHLHNPEYLSFVPNTTTACHLTLSRIDWKSGDLLLTTTHENSTVLHEIASLHTRGVRMVTLDPDAPSGLISIITHYLENEPVRAIVMSHVSHLDGRIFPIDTVLDLARSYKALLLVDGAQAVGQIPVSFRDLYPHAYFFPGHKWCAGPMGTGALILREDFGRTHAESTAMNKSRDLQQSILENFELGTQNIGLIAGFSKACEIKQKKGSAVSEQNEIQKKIKSILRRCSGIQILGGNGPQAPGILSFVCLSETAEQAIVAAGSKEAIAWKIFRHPSYPSQWAIRLSWTSNLTPSTIHPLLEGIQQTLQNA